MSVMELVLFLIFLSFLYLYIPYAFFSIRSVIAEKNEQAEREMFGNDNKEKK